MHLIADGFVIAAARAIDDQRLVPAAEEMTEQQLPPVELRV